MQRLVPATPLAFVSMRLIFLLALASLICACQASPPRSAVPVSVKDEYVKEGYRPSQLNGKLLYCRSESVTGTQFPSTVCVSEQQIKDQEQKTRDTTGSRAMHPNVQCHNQDYSE